MIGKRDYDPTPNADGDDPRSRLEIGRDQRHRGVVPPWAPREVGIRQPSLYAYFDSKNGLYDALFADGNRQLLERLDDLDLPGDPRSALKAFMGEFVTFAVEDPARCALLLQRPLPGFEPSAASYALAEGVLGRATALLQNAGIGDQGDIDCFVAMVAGLIDAQISNDPGGDRWVRHLNRLIDLHVNDALQRRAQQ